MKTVKELSVEQVNTPWWMLLKHWKLRFQLRVMIELEDDTECLPKVYSEPSYYESIGA